MIGSNSRKATIFDIDPYYNKTQSVKPKTLMTLKTQHS